MLEQSGGGSECPPGPRRPRHCVSPEMGDGEQGFKWKENGLRLSDARSGSGVAGSPLEAR